MPYTQKYYEETLEKSERQVALDMWELGELIQANHGKWTRANLEHEAPHLAYLFDAPHGLLNDFLFINDESAIWCVRWFKFNDLNKSEKRLVDVSRGLDNVWASGKKDGRWRWVRTWIYHFGSSLDPEINRKYNDLLQEWRDFYKPPARPEPVRKYGNETLEKLETVEVAHRWQLAQMMQSWMYSIFLTDLSQITFRWMADVWRREAMEIQSELEYRTEAEPKDRGSKKKNEAARRDFRKASLYLAGAEIIYADEFMQMVVKAAFPFDLNVDYEHLPKLPPDKAPVMHMDSRNLMNEFIRWVTDAEIDPDSFEAEDAQILRNRLREALEEQRKSFARAKGQAINTTSIVED